MKKSILNLEGVKAISKNVQKTIVGGGMKQLDVPVLYNPACYDAVWVMHDCLSQVNATVSGCQLSGYQEGAIAISFNQILPPPPGC